MKKSMLFRKKYFIYRKIFCLKTLFIFWYKTLYSKYLDNMNWFYVHLILITKLQNWGMPAGILLPNFCSAVYSQPPIIKGSNEPELSLLGRLVITQRTFFVRNSLSLTQCPSTQGRQNSGSSRAMKQLRHLKVGNKI